MKKILFVIVFYIAFVGNVHAYIGGTSVELYRKLDSSYVKYIADCNNSERVAIIKYADGDIDRLSGGYDTVINLKTASGDQISFDCANSAEELYNIINEGNDYISSVEVSSINIRILGFATRLDEITNVFVSGSKLKSEEDMTILDDCDLINPETKQSIDDFFGYFITFCIGITVILSVLDVFKIIFNGKVEHKKHLKTLVKRVIALVVILLVPLIVNVVVDLLNLYVNIDAINCLES